MTKDFLPDHDPEDRRQILRDSSDHIENTTYHRDISPEDMLVKRETFTLNHIEISKHDAVLDAAKADHKAITKPIKEENIMLLDQIKTRKETVTGELYSIADHYESVMNTYDEHGEFISSRRLRPEERQTRMAMHTLKTVNE
jgi:hypothetical protein